MRSIRNTLFLVGTLILFAFTQPPSVDQQEDLVLIGTTWQYTSHGLENEMNYRITFERDGRFTTDHTVTSTDDWWVLKDGVLEIHWNDDYSIGTCRLTGGNKLKGHSENSVGTKWTFTLEMVSSTKKTTETKLFR